MTHSAASLRAYHRTHVELREAVYARPGFSLDTDILASRVRSAMQRGDLGAVLAIAYDEAIPEHVRREAVATGRRYFLAYRRAFPVSEIGRQKQKRPIAPAGIPSPRSPPLRGTGRRSPSRRSSMTANAIIKHEELTGGYVERIEPAQFSMAVTPMAMLSQAVARGASIEILTKLMDLSERFEANQARKAYDEAMAGAKSEIPVIFKNKAVDFTSAKGRTNYRHEDLAEIARTVDPILAKHGLSYRFRTKTEEQRVIVTCLVSHRDGYSEENTLSAGRDESGNKNSIQAVGSTITYLQRYTLKAALGLAASTDDDGRSASIPAGSDDPITDEQAQQINLLITETKSNLDIFLKTFRIKGVPEITAKQLPEVLAKLNAKRAKMQEVTNG